MRRPSLVTVMSMWLRSLSKFGTSRIAFCSCSFSASMLSLDSTKFSPWPDHVAADFLRRSGGILEISADGVLHLLAAVQQPEHDEQRHHGGHEIGVGHFPRAAMMAAVAAFFLDDDDRSLVGHGSLNAGCFGDHAAAGASLLSLMNFSAS